MLCLGSMSKLGHGFQAGNSCFTMLIDCGTELQANGLALNTLGWKYT